MSLQISELRLALTDFDIEVDGSCARALTVLFGPSGSGKTSLLEAIAGLRRPCAGTLVLDQRVLVDVEKKIFIAPQDRGIGYVPQDGALFPHLNVSENLHYGFDHRRASPAELGFEHVVGVLEIEDFLHRKIDSLSGGEKQRVALGRALLASPKLLLLDEPLASLDTALKTRLLPYLTRIRDEFKIPMIYVTHSPEEVIALGDEVLIMERGKILQRGKPADLFIQTDQPRYILRPFGT